LDPLADHGKGVRSVVDLWSKRKRLTTSTRQILFNSKGSTRELAEERRIVRA
jgi:hypothetical protein